MKLKLFSWQFFLSIVLIFTSLAICFIHYLLFRDIHHIFYYLVLDVAFVPIEVLLVTLVIHNVLNNHEKRSMLNKLNMVVGAFYSEAGTLLLKSFSLMDTQVASLSKLLVVTNEWSPKEFLKVKAIVKSRAYTLDPEKVDLQELRNFLVVKRGFFLTLLENPNLLEHEAFTELLWAVFHLAEELQHRNTLIGLPEADYKHLNGDMRRVYGLLILDWLSYMEHLHKSYPYLFSLAMRTNPFDAAASVIVKS
ncbi:MAG: hypothetical protein WDL87_08805 [Candidatus Omnitrophota bacterium]|jgi:hypothetical protein